MKNRRELLSKAIHTCAALAMASTVVEASGEKTSQGEPAQQRFLLVGLAGSENPTRANFPIVWAAALRQAGHEVKIELAGDATVLMRTAVSESVTPVGWPPFREALARVVDLKIPIFV